MRGAPVIILVAWFMFARPTRYLPVTNPPEITIVALKFFFWGVEIEHNTVTRMKPTKIVEFSYQAFTDAIRPSHVL